MPMMIDLVKRPVMTDKAVRLMENNQYTFDVDARLNKTKIKGLIEEFFGVTVIAVNTHRPPRRYKRVGGLKGHLPQSKRAIVTLKPGDMIQLFPET
jgi:large subunit ribosomal protein L23